MKKSLPLFVRLFCISSVFLFSKSHAIVGGKIIPAELAPNATFSWVLAFNMNPGSATYIGDGMFLTSHHGYLLAKPQDPSSSLKPFLRVVDYNQKVAVSSSTDYEILTPPIEGYKEMRDSRGKKIQVPELDLSIVRVTDPKLRERLIQTYEPFRTILNLAAKPDFESKLYIAGSGETDLKKETASERRVGLIAVKEVNDRTLISRWTENSGASNGTFGDSGGPLLAETQGAVTQIGVTSGRALYVNGENKIVEAETIFVLLDYTPVKEWLKGVLESHQIAYFMRPASNTNALEPGGEPTAANSIRNICEKILREN
ncbi:MAG: trypsin-like serine protease [Bdellovibrionota bacterium]